MSRTDEREQQQRFSWDEMRRYWEVHSRRSAISLEDDPDGLDNVIHTGAPRWVNENKAATQRRLYLRFLKRVPVAPGRRALDIGCGAGRWLRVLAARGYSPTGIDLQPSLIETINLRHPEFEAHCVPIQEFDAEPFDLVSSVTVIQHIPPEEQVAVIATVARLTRPGGHALILENVRDQGVHVWAHEPREWVKMFEEAGFRLLELQRYDYGIGTRALRRFNRRRSAKTSSKARTAITPEEYRMKARKATQKKSRKPPRGLRRRVRWELGRLLKEAHGLRKRVAASRRAAVLLDRATEPALVALNRPQAQSLHCAMLFQRLPD